MSYAHKFIAWNKEKPGGNKTGLLNNVMEMNNEITVLL